MDKDNIEFRKILDLSVSDTGNMSDDKVVNKLLRDYFPKGDSYKQARDYIYEEKKTFLTAGHRKNDQGIREG